MSETEKLKNVIHIFNKPDSDCCEMRMTELFNILSFKKTHSPYTTSVITLYFTIVDKTFIDFTKQYT